MVFPGNTALNTFRYFSFDKGDVAAFCIIKSIHHPLPCTFPSTERIIHNPYSALLFSNRSFEALVSCVMPAPVTRAQLAPLFSSSPPFPGSSVWDAPLSPWLRRPDTLTAGLLTLSSEVEVRWERNLVVPLEQTLLVSEADVDWFLAEAEEHRANNQGLASEQPALFSASRCRELAVRFGPARRLSLLEYRFTEVLKELQTLGQAGTVAITDSFFCIELVRPCEPHKECGSDTIVCSKRRISDVILMADIPDWWEPHLPLLDDMRRLHERLKVPLGAIEDGTMEATPDSPSRHRSEQPRSVSSHTTTSPSTSRHSEEPANKRQRLLERSRKSNESVVPSRAVRRETPADKETSAPLGAPLTVGADPSAASDSQPVVPTVSNNEDPKPAAMMGVTTAVSDGANSGINSKQHPEHLGQASPSSPVRPDIPKGGPPLSSTEAARQTTGPPLPSTSLVEAARKKNGPPSGSTSLVEAARKKSGPPSPSTPPVEAARKKSGPPSGSTPPVEAARKKSGPPSGSTPPVEAARNKSGPPSPSTPPVEAARKKSGPPSGSTPPVEAARKKSGPPSGSTPPVEAARNKSGPPSPSTPPVEAARKKSGPPSGSTPPVEAARKKSGPPSGSTPPVEAARNKSGPPSGSTPPVEAARKKSGPPSGSTPPVEAARKKSGPPSGSTPPVEAARKKSGPPSGSTPPVEAARKKSGPPSGSTPPVEAARKKRAPPLPSHSPSGVAEQSPQVKRRISPSGAVASKTPSPPPKRQEGHTKPTAAKASSPTSSSKRRAPHPPSTTPSKGPNAIAAALSGAALSHNPTGPSTSHFDAYARPSLNINTRSPPAAFPAFSDSVIPRRAYGSSPDRPGQQEVPYRGPSPPSLRPRTFSNPGPQGSSRYTFTSSTLHSTAPQFGADLAANEVPDIAAPSFYSEPFRRGLPVLRPKEEYRANWPPPPHHRGRSGYPEGDPRGAVEIPCKFIPNKPADRS